MQRLIVNVVSDTINFLKLSQINKFFNIHNSLLDLFFNNDENCTLHLTDDELVPVDSFHPPFSFEFKIFGNSHFRNNLSFSSMRYDFINANYSSLLSNFNSIDWMNVLSPLNLNDSLHVFYNILYDAIEVFVPLKKEHYSTYHTWFSDELVRLTISKKIAHTKYKLLNSQEDYRLFSLLRSQCKLLSNKCYNDYIHRAEKSVEINPKYFWNFVNKVKGKSYIPNYMFLNDREAENDSDIAELFCERFNQLFCLMLLIIVLTM